MPRLYSTSAPSHSSGVELKRSKWSSGIFTIRSASATASSQLPHSYTPSQTRFEPASGWSTGASLSSEWRASVIARQRVVLDLDQLGGVARELARLRDDDRHRVADEAHAADGQRVVLDLVAGRRRELEEGSVSVATSSPVSVP